MNAKLLVDKKITCRLCPLALERVCLCEERRKVFFHCTGRVSGKGCILN